MIPGAESPRTCPLKAKTPDKTKAGEMVRLVGLVSQILSSHRDARTSSDQLTAEFRKQVPLLSLLAENVSHIWNKYRPNGLFSHFIIKTLQDGLPYLHFYMRKLSSERLATH
jgi:hypothetical protein